MNRNRWWESPGVRKLAQIHPWDELHDQVVAAFGIAIEVENCNDIGMVQQRRDSRFIGKHRTELRIARERRQDALDRDGSRKSFGAEEIAAEDFGHAATAEPFANLVLAGQHRQHSPSYSSSRLGSISPQVGGSGRYTRIEALRFGAIESNHES